MKIQDYVKNLQNKPIEVRNRILWVSAAVAAVVVFSIWITTFKKEVGSLSIASINTTTTSTQASAPHYLSIDAKDVVGGKLLIYFSIRNDTDDILNFSKLSDITLSVNGKTYNSSRVTDSSNNTFIVKALSHSQNFGILTFDNTEAGTAEITFDNLYFEQNPTTLFKETIPIDLNKLTTPANLRN